MKFIKNITLTLISIFISLLLAEGIVRLLFDPVDYLKPEIITDPIYGHRIKPGSASHDAWGFRNRKRLRQSDIVAIGDSNTYGVAAPSSQSWPVHLASMAKRSTYNLALGGYSTPQFMQLLNDYALKLKPKVVIIGFSYSNDLLEAYRLVYQMEYWKSWRSESFLAAQKTPTTNIDNLTPPQKSPSGFKQWLTHGWPSHNSLFFRMLLYSSAGDVARIVSTQSQGKKQYAAIADEKKNLYTVFTPQLRLNVLNLSRPEIQEGLRIALAIYKQIQIRCQKEGIHLLVALIPTKESAFTKHIEGNQAIFQSAIIDQLLKNERLVNQRVKKAFDDMGIAYVDLLSPLQKAVDKAPVYPVDNDGHTNGNGYRVIATAILDALNARHWLKENTPN
ncbi:hypothetical protein ACQZV8_01800 [Magnetococcales bacterium HHB-1]